MAQLAFAAAGAQIGGAIGGTFLGISSQTLGYAAGSIVGNLLFPPEFPDHHGPRLNDLDVTSSTFGQPIPRVYGTIRAAGNIIWADTIQETKTGTSAGGKGGPSQTQYSYTYSCSFAIGLCEGEITGIKKIWADSILIYDATTSATIEQVEANALVPVTFYYGTETQLPDPLIESFEGTGNVPAYRGLGYMVFEDLQLADYGNRIPNIRAEIVVSGTATTGITEIYRNLNEEAYGAGEYADLKIENGLIVANMVNENGNAFAEATSVYDYYHNPNNLSYIERKSAVRYKHYTNIFSQHAAVVLGILGDVWQFEMPSTYPGTVFIYSKEDGATGEYIARWTSSSFGYTPFNSTYGISLTSSREYVAIYLYDINLVARILIYDTSLNLYRSDTIERSGATLFANYEGPAGQFCISDDLSTIWTSNSAGDIQIYRYNEDTSNYDLLDLLNVSGATGYQVCTNNVLWRFDAGQKIYTYGSDLSGLTVLLADVITAICQDAGLSTSDIDVSGITQTVSGYAVSRLQSGRSLLQQLAIGYYFDGFESDFKLKFVERLA